MPDRIITQVNCIHINNKGNREKLPYMALYFETDICPDTNNHCKIKNPVPVNIPAINAFLNLTLVLGISINMAVKNSQVNKNEAHLNENVMIGDMNSKSKMFCNVDDTNIDNPLEHIINTGRMSSIAV